METQTGNAKLFAKIATVMRQVRTLEKTGRNQFDKYDYVTADAIATRIGSALGENGIAFLPSLVSVETSEYTTKSGGANFRTVVHMQMTLACTESGATYTSLWSGEAIDRSDKSISKAAVSAVKYYLLKTFLLAGGDDEDADASSPEVERSTAKPSKSSSADDVAFGNPFDAPDKPAVLSDEQLQELNIVGREFYGQEWDEQRPKLVEAVSKGAISSSKELTPHEATKLIKGIKRKAAEMAKAQQPEPA